MDSSSSFILTTVAAAIGIFTLLRNLRCHQQDDKENNSSSSTSSPPSSSSSLSPPSSLDRIWTHHVFPSFRGEDVRRDFLSHIQMEFQRMGITPFIDNEIKRGQSIGPELIRAIRESKIAIILLSRNYASSSWCLDELAEIMKCRDELGQTVLAVFYKVDPSDVKKLTGDFGKVFKKTCAGKTKEHVGRWSQALANVATIAGYHSSNWDNEATMIRNIATDISNKLNNSASSSDFDGLVGMTAHLKKMEPLLCLGSDEVRMIGIWGPSGIGKTTIARVVYNKLSNNFQLSVFMESIEAKYTRPCSDDYSAKLQLQQQFMSQITNQSDMKISHLGVVQDRLKDKKVLVVLDGVDKSMQLDAMAKETWWFGPGSRIIITAQDRKIFREHGINHIYKVGFPSTDEALQILCTYAFGQNSPKHGFEELAWEVTQLAGELPLCLRVIGSYFRGMSKLEWTKALPRLRSSLDADILSILKFSYDALDDEDKYLFLHIACFFNHEWIVKVEEYLAETFLDVSHRLNVLAEKSLISMNDRVIMHDLLVKLGRDIVRKQSLREPGQRLFLVDAREICEVLNLDANVSYDALDDEDKYLFLHIACFFNHEWIVKVEEYLAETFLDVSHRLNVLAEKSLISMNDRVIMHDLLVKLGRDIVRKQSLREPGQRLFLVDAREICEVLNLDANGSRSLMGINFNFGEDRIKEKLHISERAFQGMSNLQFLRVIGKYNTIHLPHGLEYISRKLRLLHWPYFPMTCLPPIFNTEFLVELDMPYSKLEKLWEGIKPFPNLKRMDLSSSLLLKELTDLSTATNLQKLNLRDCSSLVKLPSTIGYTKNLRKLYLGGCSSLVELPFSIGNLINLKVLNLSSLSCLVELPFSIGNATNLKELYLGGCSSLVELPSSTGNLINLKELDLSSLSCLVELPSSTGNLINLKELDLSLSCLVELPSTIGNLINLKKLDLSSLSCLVELPFSIGNLINLKELDLSSCSSLINLPSSIGNATNLKKLYLDHCSNLVKLPFSIGNLQKLQTLTLRGCSKLEDLPANIKLGSLWSLDLTDCILLKRFPEISTNVGFIWLIGTAIEEVPSSIKSWSRLNEVDMSYSENLKNFPHAFDIITRLQVTNTEIQEFPPWVKKFSRLTVLILKGCKKLVSLPHIPDSISSIDAEDCESLERLDCSFHNPNIWLKFAKCFKLNQEARDLIIQTPTSNYAILPGREVPAYFTHQSTTGGSLTIKLNEKPLPTSMRFKACILLVHKGDNEARDDKNWMDENGYIVSCNQSTCYLYPVLAEHVYVFEVEADVTSSELVFEFKIDSTNWKIKECGVFQLSEVP